MFGRYCGVDGHARRLCIPADGYDGVAGDVLNHFNRLEGEELDLIVGIVGHRWLTGILQFQCKLSVDDDDDTDYFIFDVLKEDMPKELAEYIIRNHVDNPTGGAAGRTGRYSCWARKNVTSDKIKD